MGGGGCKPIKGTGCSHGISPHVREIEPVTNLEFWELDFPGNDINGVTGGSKEGARGGQSVGGRHEVSLGLGVVILYVVEGAIDAISKVVVVVTTVVAGTAGMLAVVFLLHNPLGNNGHHQGVGASGKVPPWFSYESHGGIEKLCPLGLDHLSKLDKHIFVGTRESSPNVHQGEVDPQPLSVIKDLANQCQCRIIGYGIKATAADMEADTHDIQLHLHCHLKQV